MRRDRLVPIHRCDPCPSGKQLQAIVNFTNASHQVRTQFDLCAISEAQSCVAQRRESSFLLRITIVGTHFSAKLRLGPGCNRRQYGGAAPVQELCRKEQPHVRGKSPPTISGSRTHVPNQHNAAGRCCRADWLASSKKTNIRAGRQCRHFESVLSGYLCVDSTRRQSS